MKMFLPDILAASKAAPGVILELFSCNEFRARVLAG